MTIDHEANSVKKFFSVLKALGLLSGLIACLVTQGCGVGGGENSNSVPVSINLSVPAKTASLGSPFEQMLAKAIGSVMQWFPGASAAWAINVTDIQSIRVEVSASDISPPETVTVPVNNAQGGQVITVNLAVEAGTNRTFTVFGINGSGTKIFIGRQSGVNLVLGNAAIVNVTLTDIPVVTSVVPATGATGASTLSIISVTFSKAIIADSIINSTLSTLTDPTGAEVSGTVNCPNPCFAPTFTPDSPLASNTIFTVTVGLDVIDTEGFGLNQAFTSTFTTGANGGGAGTVSGTVTNASNGNPIPGATVTIQGNNLSTNTGTTGAYTLNGVSAGPQTVQATANGFITNSAAITVLTGQTITQGISLSPGINPGQFQIILNWGQNPNDLDAHLLVPQSGGSTDVLFSNRGSLTVSPFASLDQDDTSSFGPETITIASPTANSRTVPQLPFPGIYNYFVCNFSGESTTPIAQSGAGVQVLFGLSGGGTAVQENFSVPSGTGPVWNIFTINGDTGVFTILGNGNGVLQTSPPNGGTCTSSP